MLLSVVSPIYKGEKMMEELVSRIEAAVSSFTDDYDIANTDYYQKSYTTVGEHRFSLGTNYISMSNDPAYETYVYKIHNGVITDYNDYEIQDKKYIDVFTPLTNKEKIYVTLSLKNTENNPIACAYVIESSTFVPSDSEILHREFVSMSEVINGSVVLVNDYSLKIPSTDINSTDKIAVQYKKSNGSRMPFTNFNYSDGYIIIHNYDEQHHTTYFNEYEHIMMTQFDYKYLYDKIANGQKFVSKFKSMMFFEKKSNVNDLISIANLSKFKRKSFKICLNKGNN